MSRYLYSMFVSASTWAMYPIPAGTRKPPYLLTAGELTSSTLLNLKKYPLKEVLSVEC